MLVCIIVRHWIMFKFGDHGRVSAGHS